VVEDCDVKRLTVVLLVFSVFTPAVFAQTVESVEHAEHRLKIFSGWLQIVKDAERDYKEKNGRYGDLAALRNAHALRSLVFESGTRARSLVFEPRSSAGARAKAQANFVPKGTFFQVTVSQDGQHFNAVIGEECVSVSADDMGNGGSGCCHCGPEVYHYLPDLEGSPEGPIIAVAG
jgi:hypothetical protein